MNAQHFAEQALLLFALTAIGYGSHLILKGSQVYDHRRTPHYVSNAYKLCSSSTTMVLSILSNPWDTVQAVPEESISTVSSPTTSTMKPIHITQPEESTSPVVPTPSSPITVEGVELPGHRIIDGMHLKRNGHGLRSLTYFGIGIRIYVASMYSSKPILSVQQALGGSISQQEQQDNGPIQLDFTFLRYVRRSQVVSAWTQQLDHSISYKDYEGYDADRQKFIDLASSGPIENQGRQSIQLVGEETRIIDQGNLKGVIRGRNFQRSFLSMWFGNMAVAEDLKMDLLKGDEHVKQQQTLLHA